MFHFAVQISKGEGQGEASTTRETSFANNNSWRAARSLDFFSFVDMGAKVIYPKYPHALAHEMSFHFDPKKYSFKTKIYSSQFYDQLRLIWVFVKVS